MKAELNTAAQSAPNINLRRRVVVGLYFFVQVALPPLPSLSLPPRFLFPARHGGWRQIIPSSKTVGHVHAHTLHPTENATGHPSS